MLIPSFPVYLNQQNIRVATYLSSGSDIEKQSQVGKTSNMAGCSVKQPQHLILWALPCA
jgi:hypothetical protein